MRDIQTIAGTWRLMGAGASSALLTPHHVKFVFSVEGGFEARTYDRTITGSFRLKWSLTDPGYGCGSSLRCPFPETLRSCHG